MLTKKKTSAHHLEKSSAWMRKDGLNTVRTERRVLADAQDILPKNKERPLQKSVFRHVFS